MPSKTKPSAIEAHARVGKSSRLMALSTSGVLTHLTHLKADFPLWSPRCQKDCISCCCSGKWPIEIDGLPGFT